MHYTLSGYPTLALVHNAPKGHVESRRTDHRAPGQPLTALFCWDKKWAISFARFLVGLPVAQIGFAPSAGKARRIGAEHQAQQETDLAHDIDCSLTGQCGR